MIILIKICTGGEIGITVGSYPIIVSASLAQYILIDW